MKPQLLIGAASSGSGKTTFTLGLLRALKNRGMKVQPFKCGPDYIDTKYHQLAAGEESVNLDLFMSSDLHVRDIYANYGNDADVCITEGVMGLYDGYDGSRGSSAEIAQLLNLPVVLILNAKSMAYSVAPILYGYKHFNKDLNLIGVVFNKVSSPVHYAYLRQACTDTGVECLGYLPNQKEIEIPSRHLGLSLDDGFCLDGFADRVAALLEEYVDIDRLLQISSVSFPSSSRIHVPVSPLKKSDLCIAVARDEAFNFIYRENLAQLSRLGNVVFFSRLTDEKLPPAHLVYLPGGYPELHLQTLSQNKTMLASVREYADNGGKLFAECGGMMYLCRTVTGIDGKSYPLASVFNQEATMDNMKLTLGYRTFTYNGIEELKGHEFHYSQIINSDNTSVTDTCLYNARGSKTKTVLFRYKNTIAGYTHLYWGDMDLMDLWNKNHNK